MRSRDWRGRGFRRAATRATMAASASVVVGGGLGTYGSRIELLWVIDVIEMEGFVVELGFWSMWLGAGFLKVVAVLSFSLNLGLGLFRLEIIWHLRKHLAAIG